MLRKLIAAVFITTSTAAAAQGQGVTIAAMGDSLTAGYGLAQDTGFVPQLQAWLDAQGADVQLINAGVSGDTTAGGASRLAWTLTPDVDGLIVALGGNDYLRGLDPLVSRANLDAILSGAAAANVPVLLAGLQVGGNYGPDYKAAFEANYADLAAQYGALFYPDFLAGLRAGGDAQGDITALMQADGIHPNSAGVALIVADIGPQVLALAAQIR